jgi:protease I
MDEAVADGNLVTAPAWPALASWLARFQEVLVQAAAKSSNLVEV